MKVYLGPYISPWRCRIHDRYMNKKYSYIWPDVEEWTPFERALEKLEDGIQFIYRHTINRYLNRKKRKEKVRIDRYDTWSMDYTLALIILPLLKKLRETKHGHPWVDDEDVPEELRAANAPPVKEEWEWDDNNPKRWDWVLDEMIHTFQCCVDEYWEDQFYSGEHDISWEKTEDGKYYQAKKGPNDTFTIDREALEKAWDRRKNGLRLFAKYYHSLWD